jgi:hypothetical protein
MEPKSTTRLSFRHGTPRRGCQARGSSSVNVLPVPGVLSREVAAHAARQVAADRQTQPHPLVARTILHNFARLGHAVQP